MPVKTFTTSHTDSGEFTLHFETRDGGTFAMVISLFDMMSFSAEMTNGMTDWSKTMETKAAALNQQMSRLIGARH